MPNPWATQSPGLADSGKKVHGMARNDTVKVMKSSDRTKVTHTKQGSNKKGEGGK